MYVESFYSRTHSRGLGGFKNDSGGGFLLRIKSRIASLSIRNRKGYSPNMPKRWGPLHSSGSSLLELAGDPVRRIELLSLYLWQYEK